MIRKLVDFALDNRFLVIVMAILLFGWGAISFHNLPVEAYPDVANNYVTVITQWPGRAAEEVEQQVTVPLEIGFAGIPHMTHLRSTSLAGLSSVTMIFDDDSINDWNREKVVERMTQVTLPNNLQPQIGTDWSPVGQIYWYTLQSNNPLYDTMALKSLEDWTLEKNLRTVPGVVDVSSFGGPTREYQVTLDPAKLVSYGLNIAQVKQALASNNTNAGGSFIEQGAQQINVREIGLFASTEDIANTPLKAQNGTALRVRDIATVVQGPKIRLGQIGRTIRSADGKLIDDPDAVEGIALLQKGANSDETLEAIHQKVDELNDRVLPKGVKIVPFLDRSNLLHLTTHTVLHNLTEGIVLVVIILFLFLGNLRGAFIVAITIPFALLFASICLDLKHIPANLLSLGALDFGMVVDGAVVMVENIVRHLSHNRREDLTVNEQIRMAAHEVQRPVFYAIGIIITAYLPIFTLQSVEGRLFKPMSWTVAFALLGALIFSMLLAPVLASFLFKKGTTEWENPLLRWLTGRYRVAAQWAIEHRYVTVGVAGAALATSIILIATGVVGSEFLPHLDEGAIWARGTLAPSTGPTESLAVANRARIILSSFPEVKQVISQIGRPDDGTDTTGFFNTEYYVDLKPKDEWRGVFRENKDELIDAMNRQLAELPGVIWNFSQPISDNVEEAVSGVKGELAVKLYGTDLKTLESKADEIVRVMSTIRGIQDLGLFRVIGQPNLNFVVDRDAAARFGINVADVQDAIETAVGGNSATQFLDGEARYDVMTRYAGPYRSTPEAINDIRIVAPSGERVSLAQVTRLQTTDGAEEIYRENGLRYVAIKYSVRDRDLGSTVEEAIAKVSKQVTLPAGYKIDWAGEYESQKRSSRRLLIVLPITILLIFIILYTMFGSAKWASLILANVAMAPIGGLLALLATGTHFSVSSGVGFLALFGVSVQTGIIMLEYMNQLRANGDSPEKAAIEGAVLRLRPILMTMLVATLGLLPAALSHGIGSDSQRPFAIVIVGGLVGALIINVFLLPTLYVWLSTNADVLPGQDEEFAS
ncbi:heavy metal efflux pump, cobalt-zinc-cadmium [Terriglobus roseus DSM 18391]|uniref:Heavy metal efflux pump, cobalt-zinc-cadmium n=1 Tax=Terriglobus roseus (strain DSM 18391 / NRRL B-41598 / KBS 63) TaxID=926566 RepID=I3ZE76_TERRK|nr:CusA/CzcA family heavy metal efflux RND transporter [Terriglobus roseus]AFL87544.1 heavy metal efflux pump, cobalt-zinc-cadmium [Terriglobus roseus DSM 18391]